MRFFSHILLVFLLLSVTAERVAHFWVSPKKQCTYAEQEQSETSTDCEKEKDNDETKDKISMHFPGHHHFRPEQATVNEFIITHKLSAFLKQPELPPDQA